MDVRADRRDPWPVVGTVCAVAFLVVGAIVAQGADLRFDAWVSSFIQGLGIPTAVWETWSRAGGATLLIVGSVLVVVAGLTRHLRLALIVAATLIAAAYFTDVVKDYIVRPRPPGAAGSSIVTYSFPSGHALNSTVTYGLVALIVWRSPLRRSIRFAVAVVVGVAFPLLIGLSRIGLDVHHPTDVLGGWLAGAAFVALAATLIRRTRAMEPGP